MGVGCDKRGLYRKRMGRDRRIEILDLRSTSLEACLGATVRLTHDIRPFGSRQFGTNELKVRLQSTPHTTMTEASLIGALREAFDSAVVVRARRLARQVSWNGAETAARRLEAKYGG